MADVEVIKPADESSLRAFVLFIVLVWVAMGLGVVLAGLFHDKLPTPARRIMDPTQASEATANPQQA